MSLSSAHAGVKAYYDDVKVFQIPSAHLTVTPSKPTYAAGEEVTLTATYTNGTANITFEVDRPNATVLLIQTNATDANGVATHTFKLVDDAIPGIYTVYVTNDKDDATGTTTFTVGLPDIIIESFVITDGVLGGTVTANVTIRSTLTTDLSILLVVQVTNADNEPMTPEVKQTSVLAWTTPSHEFTISIPADAPTGTYSAQAQLLTDYPRNDGYALDYKDGTFAVS